MIADTSVKVYRTPAGVLWAAPGIEVPQRVVVQESLFWQRLYQQQISVCIPGDRQHALLIAEHAAQLPMYVKAPGGNDIASIFHAMRNCSRPAALGGWARVTTQTLPIFRVMAHPSSTNLQDVPFWPHLSYVTGLREDCVAQLVASIGDPRWHVDLRHPYRLARLRAYLRVTPKNIRRCLTMGYAAAVVQPSLQRCANALYSWYPEDGTQMANFLRRRYLARKDVASGALRATDTFLVYLARNWLASVLNNSALDMFLPHSMLSVTEAEDYMHHVFKK